MVVNDPDQSEDSMSTKEARLLLQEAAQAQEEAKRARSLAIEAEELASKDEEDARDLPAQAQLCSPKGQRTSLTGDNAVMMGREMILLCDTPKNVVTLNEVLYKKEARARLSEKECTDLFEKMTRIVHRKFDLLPLTLSDEDKLDDTYNLGMLIQRTRQAHMWYDMQDVFNIVFPQSDGKTIDKYKDLYTDYATITIEQVTKSNRWYRTWPSAPTFEENLKLMYRLMQNNVTDSLYDKVYETYCQYPVEEQGGPLFFIIMMNLLLSNSEAAAESLIKRVRDLRIDAIQGENIDKAVSWLRAALHRLKHIGKTPLDITKTLLTIMQTSSVEKFNDTFYYFEQQRMLEHLQLGTGQRVQITPDKILQAATIHYHALLESGMWTGINTPGLGAFNASKAALPKGPPAPSDQKKGGKKGPVCWNCGGKHKLNKCKKPRNEEKIKEAKEKSRKGCRKSCKSSKWAAPQEGKSNCKMIDNKYHTYNAGTKRWVPDKEEAKANIAQMTVSPPTTTVTQANAKMALNNAMQEFMESFAELA
jgi:hypothetical protein